MLRPLGALSQLSVTNNRLLRSILLLSRKPKTEAEWWCWDLSLWPFPSRSLPCAPPGGRQPPLHGRAKGSPSEMLARCSPFHHLYLEVLASKG